MIKYLTTTWLIVGALLAAAYFSPPIQRLVKQSDARKSLEAAYEAREKALALCAGASPTAKDEAAAEWQRVLRASQDALNAMGDASGNTKIMTQILKAQAMAQTGEADLAIRDLMDLEDRLEGEGEGNELEAVHAALAQTNYQVALMIRAESSEGDAWVKRAETACAYSQELLKNARDEAAANAYRENLACVSRFLFGHSDGSECLGMPPVKTVDCKKKMSRIERERPQGGRARARYVPSPPDESDALRREQIKKTRQGEDEGI